MNVDDPLAHVTIQLSPDQPASLRSLVDGWAQHVKRLYAERDYDLDGDPDCWGAHDYAGALYLRDTVAFGLEQTPLEIADIAQSSIASTDKLFLSYTEPDGAGMIDRFERAEHHDSAWWWKRIPKTGPVRQELIRTLHSDASLYLAIPGDHDFYIGTTVIPVLVHNCLNPKPRQRNLLAGIRTGSGGEGLRRNNPRIWWEPNGGEWRWHPADKHHAAH